MACLYPPPPTLNGLAISGGFFLRLPLLVRCKQLLMCIKEFKLSKQTQERSKAKKNAHL